jgi:hypothetical protein
MRHKDRLAAVKYRSFDYDVKAVGDDGLSGYGSVFGVVDSYNEVVAPAHSWSRLRSQGQGPHLPRALAAPNRRAHRQLEH